MESVITFVSHEYILWTPPQHHHVTAEVWPRHIIPRHDNRQTMMDDSEHNGSEWANQSMNDDIGCRSSLLLYATATCDNDTQWQHNDNMGQQNYNEDTKGGHDDEPAHT